ncbi:hypothetical protein AS156_07045 [Bradyrhizobium macuxiense]|uniref:Uncharacterized protein n=1 Tax=Bradyrhizobium macuxiense TaxID=1755647 RepID=A0A109JTC4_9BRAD|nr:hypothetical protein AS156_07045 [Bradyrhizobium macuxiense]
MAGDRDHHRNVGIACTFDQVDQPLAGALSPAEAIDDHEVGSGLKRAGNPRGSVLEPFEI